MPDGAKPARLTIDGVEQQYYSSLDVEYTSNDKPIETIPGGFIGHSDGVHTVKISGMSEITTQGREYDFVEAMRQKKTVDLGYRMQGVTREHRGRFTSAKEQSKTGDKVQVEWSYEGRQIR